MLISFVECFPPPLGVYPVITAKQSHAEIVVICFYEAVPPPYGDNYVKMAK
jgi:hypothetical protein